MVKIGVHLRKLSQNYNRGTTFLDHPGIDQAQATWTSHTVTFRIANEQLDTLNITRA